MNYLLVAPWISLFLIWSFTHKCIVGKEIANTVSDLHLTFYTKLRIMGKYQDPSANLQKKKKIQPFLFFFCSMHNNRQPHVIRKCHFYIWHLLREKKKPCLHEQHGDLITRTPVRNILCFGSYCQTRSTQYNRAFQSFASRTIFEKTCSVWSVENRYTLSTNVVVKLHISFTPNMPKRNPFIPPFCFNTELEVSFSVAYRPVFTAGR